MSLNFLSNYLLVVGWAPIPHTDNNRQLLFKEGIAIFSWLAAFLLVSKEKEKSGPKVKKKLKAWPWLASAWQKSMHLVATAVILLLHLI